MASPGDKRPKRPSAAKTLWIDDAGQLHLAEDGIGNASIDSALTRHLGNVKMTITSNETSLTWDVDNVTDLALAGAREHLLSRPDREVVVLNFFHGGWTTEQAPSAEGAVAKIAAIQRFRDVTGLPHTTIDVGSPVQMRNAQPTLASVYSLWRRTGGRFANATNDELSCLLPQILIFRHQVVDDDLELVFIWVGSRSYSMQVHGREWAREALVSSHRRAVGGETESYVNRIAEAYKDVFETGDPHYARIRTRIPPDERSDPVCLDYHRLLLRFELHDGKPGLIVLSKPESERAGLVRYTRRAPNEQ